jgi:hypothetical protein
LKPLDAEHSPNIVTNADCFSSATTRSVSSSNDLNGEKLVTSPSSSVITSEQCITLEDRGEALKTLTLTNDSIENKPVKGTGKAHSTTRRSGCVQRDDASRDSSEGEDMGKARGNSEMVHGFDDDVRAANGPDFDKKDEANANVKPDTNEKEETKFRYTSHKRYSGDTEKNWPM